jgi:hypothetical protein
MIDDLCDFDKVYAKNEAITRKPFFLIFCIQCCSVRENLQKKSKLFRKS